MTDAEEFDDERDDHPRYRDIAEIGTGDLYEALTSLAGFAENPYLAMQASQLCLVDNTLNALEQEVMLHQFDDEPPRGKIALLGALSPMWIYAAYELQRTWRQRCEDVIKLAENSGIDLKAAHLERDPPSSRQAVDLYCEHAGQLREAASSFTLEWVWQTSLAMLCATALKENLTLEAAQERLEGKRIAAIGRVLSRMFSVSALDDEDADDHQAGGKARQRLEALWTDGGCAAEILRAERVLWCDLDESFENWLRGRHLRTLAEACLTAVHAIATDIGEGELVVDVLDEGARPLILISESAPGGVGQIEAFVQTALHGEGIFEKALLHALDFCPREHISENLVAVAAQARRLASPLADAFAHARAARGYQQILEAKKRLTNALEDSVLGASRQDVVAVTGRLLQPNSRPATDAWFDGLNRLWANREKRLGAPIDSRVFAYLLVDTPSLRKRFSAMIEQLTGQQPTEAQLFARMHDFLLPGCHDSCPQCLVNSNRFASEMRPSRELTIGWLSASQPAVTTIAADEGWSERVRQLLEIEDRIDILATDAQLESVARTLQALLTEPFERDYLLVWPIVSAVRRGVDGWRVGIEIRSMGVR